MTVWVGTPSRGVVAIDAMDVSGMFVGETIGVIGSDALYKLTASNDAIDGDDVIGVAGNATLRWIKQRIDASTATTKVLPGTGGNVQLGADGALADDAETGYVTIPTVGADFDDATEPAIDEGHVAIVFQTTANRLGVFIPGTGWVWTPEMEADA